MMLVEVIMGVFIANFKASEHPIISIIVRGLLVAVIGFFIALFSSILEGWDFSIGFALIFSLIIGLAVSIFLFAVEAFFNYIDKK
ncbi:putative membrane protein [Acinetobacter baumannii 299505]|nr:putative membrane protein [Acinetobacter baumannii 299505]EXE88997.1 putative membrane protein [Acinetobacter baumannii 532279]